MKLHPAYLFLFQQSVIICHFRARTSEFGRDEYKYWHKFLINKMKVRDIAKGGDETEFELHDTQDEEMNMTIRTSTLEETKDWVARINKEIKGLDMLARTMQNPRKLSQSTNPHSPPSKLAQ